MESKNPNVFEDRNFLDHLACLVQKHLKSLIYNFFITRSFSLFRRIFW